MGQKPSGATSATQLIFLCLLTINVSAQTHLPLHFESLSINEGLSQGYISCIFQDKKGIMWFATGDGLNKYDGYAFTVYNHDQNDSASLISDDLTCVFEDSKGRLWIGTRQNGIDLFDREKQTFAHLRRSQNKGLRSDNILGITEDKTGALWIRSRAGIDRLEIANGKSPPLLTHGANPWQQYYLLFSTIKLDSVFEAEKSKYGPEEIFINSHNRIFLTTNNRLWELIYHGKQHAYQLLQRLSYPVADSAFIPLVLEDTVNKSMLINRKVVIRYPAQTFNRPKVMVSYNTFKVRWTIDKIQRLWLADDGRITQVDLQSGDVQHIISSDPLQTQALEAITFLFTDRTGVVWIGTGGYGLLKFDPEIERFHHSLKNTAIYQLIPGDSGKIINNRFQELKIEKGRTPVVTTLVDSSIIRKSFPKLPVMSFTKDTASDLWIGIHGGILKYDRKAKSINRFNLPYTEFTTLPFPLYADRLNNIWMGYNRYLARYNIATGAFTRFYYPTQYVSYDYDFLQCIYEDDSLLWLGSTNGMFCFDLQKESWPYVYAYDPQNGHSLSNNFVLSFCRDTKEPEKYLWVGTKGGGLNRLDKTTGHFTRYDTHNGLPNNVVYGIVPDQSGNLWLSTNKGLSAFNVKKKTFRNYDVRDGLQSNEFNRYAYTKTDDGLLVFGGMNGLNYFDPSEVKPLPPPAVVITDFRLFNKPVVLKKTTSGVPVSIQYARKVLLAYEQNVITLQFSGTDYRKQGTIGYRYMMKGFDKRWIYSAAAHEATYTNLNPGEYTFLVQASFKNAAWGTDITSLHITVIPPWWRTWWFYLTVITVISSSAFGLYRYRIYQLTRLESLRNQIARDLHDEVGSSISTIAIYSKIAFEQLGSKTFNNEALLKKITDYASEIMDSMNDIVWNINAKNDAFEHIINRMREHAYQLLEAKGYTLHLSFDESLYQAKLAMEKRRDFYLIYKEALNNVAKYAHGKNVWIRLKPGQAGFQLTIRDDGKGFDSESARKGGNGLTNMHFRAAALNGTIKITSKPGEGTEVSLIFSAGNTSLF